MTSTLSWILRRKKGELWALIHACLTEGFTVARARRRKVQTPRLLADSGLANLSQMNCEHTRFPGLITPSLTYRIYSVKAQVNKNSNSEQPPPRLTFGQVVANAKIPAAKLFQQQVFLEDLSTLYVKFGLSLLLLLFH